MATEAQINANRENAKKGGRKKGIATVEREKAKDYIAQRIGEYMPEIFDVLIGKALDGDVPATKELFDRAWGKARQDLGFDPTKPLIIQISEAIARKNDTDSGSK